MKIMPLFLPLFVLMFSAFSVDAAVPRGAMKWGQTDKAIERAVKSKKLLVYIYSRKDSSCGLESATLNIYMKALGSRGVIVHLPSEEAKEWKPQCNKAVLAEIQRSKVVPRMVIVDPVDHKILKTVLSEATKKDPEKMSKEIKAVMKDSGKTS